MRAMLLALDTSHFERSLLNEEALAKIPNMSLALDTSHLETSLLNADAPQNIPLMSVTLATSHLERSLLNELALNMMSYPRIAASKI